MDTRLFTLDELLYYVNFSTSLHCDEPLTSQIVYSLTKDLVDQNVIPQHVMTETLKRNEIKALNMTCACCKKINLHDSLEQCPSCKRHVHGMCFWKPRAFCNRQCMKASQSSQRVS